MPIYAVLGLESLLSGNFAAAFRQARLNPRMRLPFSILGRKRALAANWEALMRDFVSPLPKHASER
jgi:hypothetical protein